VTVRPIRTIERWAAQADPLILPSAALLTGLGLVLFSRADGGDQQVVHEAGTPGMFGARDEAGASPALASDHVVASFGEEFGLASPDRAAAGVPAADHVRDQVRDARPRLFQQAARWRRRFRLRLSAGRGDWR
jgi:hypothetical protein